MTAFGDRVSREVIKLNEVCRAGPNPAPLVFLQEETRTQAQRRNVSTLGEEAFWTPPLPPTPPPRASASRAMRKLSLWPCEPPACGTSSWQPSQLAHLGMLEELRTKGKLLKMTGNFSPV